LDIDLSDSVKTKIFNIFKAQINIGVEIKMLIKVFAEKGNMDDDQKDFLSKNTSTINLFRDKLIDLQE
jgi:hypothetical protein